MTDNRFKELMAADKDMMTVLTIIASLPLADAWLAAGAIRNFMWNQLAYGIGFDTDTDIDVVFYDPSLPYEASQLVENHLHQNFPNYRWEVRNQADMHCHSPNTKPYLSTCDAISKYPERCTAIGLRLIDDQLELFAPYGLADILAFECHPTPHFLADKERLLLYQKRLATKDWQKKWSQISYYLE
ncbi:UNVERIFIED_CONTAM: nucleotidyltransferase family protein [Streptococcus canis]|uniref:nucleotidyltransferase family protein n=1 Tax=Streptococcus canis TaxID=1329 RepID=UPI001141F8E4|nr:nucleotidyltransferase family protein [Streptococcus canis]MDV6000402.1 nucleotidyltransferase family protein [Streptococcus canis]MDV6021640.1 nucleotidyltransferase family protein [Streptococcus canis]